MNKIGNDPHRAAGGKDLNDRIVPPPGDETVRCSPLIGRTGIEACSENRMFLKELPAILIDLQPSCAGLFKVKKIAEDGKYLLRVERRKRDPARAQGRRNNGKADLFTPFRFHNGCRGAE